MDFDQLQQALGLASSTLGITGKAADTINSIKRLVDGGTKPDSEEAQKLLNGLATDLTAANVMNVELSVALKKLSEELHRQDEFEREKARYELFKTQENDFVLKLKETAADGEPMHYICPVCFRSEKLVSYLSGKGDNRHCQRNSGHVFRFQNTPIRGARTRGGF